MLLEEECGTTTSSKMMGGIQKGIIEFCVYLENLFFTKLRRDNVSTLYEETFVCCAMNACSKRKSQVFQSGVMSLQMIQRTAKEPRITGHCQCSPQCT